MNARRSDVSAAFFVEQEFQQTGLFIYGLYRGSLGRNPAYVEFASDRHQVVGGPNLQAAKAAFAQAFTARAEFLERYQAKTTPEEFVDALLNTVETSSGIDLGSQRASLLDKYNSSSNLSQARSLVMRSVIESAAFTQAEYSRAFVLAEYFGYLQRDPDPSGYYFWLNVLNSREPGNYRGMVCSFITSAEYQSRFGFIVSHTNAECAR